MANTGSSGATHLNRPSRSAAAKAHAPKVTGEMAQQGYSAHSETLSTPQSLLRLVGLKDPRAVEKRVAVLAASLEAWRLKREKA